jgi:hypothetical protein
MPGERHWLNFVDAQHRPVTLECRVDLQPQQVLLLGEAPLLNDAKSQNQLLEMSNELTVLHRENVRKNRDLTQAKEALQRTLDELRTTTGHLERIQEFLPICYVCQKVRPDQDEGTQWTSLMSYLAENAVFFSHGLCPECYESEMAKIEAESRELLS